MTSSLVSSPGPPAVQAGRGQGSSFRGHPPGDPPHASPSRGQWPPSLSSEGEAPRWAGGGGGGAGLSTVCPRLTLWLCPRLSPTLPLPLWRVCCASAIAVPQGLSSSRAWGAGPLATTLPPLLWLASPERWGLTPGAPMLAPRHASSSVIPPIPRPLGPVTCGRPPRQREPVPSVWEGGAAAAGAARGHPVHPRGPAGAAQVGVAPRVPAGAPRAGAWERRRAGVWNPECPPRCPSLKICRGSSVRKAGRRCPGLCPLGSGGWGAAGPPIASRLNRMSGHAGSPAALLQQDSCPGCGLGRLGGESAAA